MLEGNKEKVWYTSTSKDTETSYKDDGVCMWENNDMSVGEKGG